MSLGFVLPCTWPPFAPCYLATLQLGSDNNSKVSKKKKKNNLKCWTWIVLMFSFLLILDLDVWTRFSLCLLSLFAFNQDLPPDAPSTGFLYLLPDKLYSGHNLLKPSEHYHPLRTLMDSPGSRFRMFFLYFRIWNRVNRHDDVTHQLFSCASLCRFSPTLHQLWLAELRLNFWASLFFPFSSGCSFVSFLISKTGSVLLAH